MFVSVCVCFSFSAEGGGGHSTGRPENGELLKQATHHVEPHTQQTGLTYNANDHKAPPKAKVTTADEEMNSPSIKTDIKHQ